VQSTVVNTFTGTMNLKSEQCLEFKPNVIEGLISITPMVNLLICDSVLGPVRMSDCVESGGKIIGK
jgi:hypothetical protein